MKTELRHGKYTEDELVEIMLGRISDYERNIVNDTLSFLDLKLNDFIFNNEEGLLRDDNSVNISKVLDSSLFKKIREKLSNADEGEKLNYTLFIKIIPNIMFEYSKFCIEIHDVNNAIEGQELIIQNNPYLKSRLNALYPKDYDDVIENMKHTVVELKKARLAKNKKKARKIVWNREDAQLSILSNILFKYQFTNNEQAFENAINKEEICIIKEEMTDVFVILIYKLTEVL